MAFKPVQMNIREFALANDNFKMDVATTDHMQCTVMCITPGEDIGMEEHPMDQYTFIVAGTGRVVLDGSKRDLKPDDMVTVPHGTEHNFINTGKTDLKLFSVYSPEDIPAGACYKTKADALAADPD